MHNAFVLQGVRASQKDAAPKKAEKGLLEKEEKLIRRTVALFVCDVGHQKGDNMYQREMVLYTRGSSLRCWRARRFLGRAGYSFEVVDVAEDPGLLAKLSGVAHREVSPPYVFVENRPLGGMGTVRALVGSGQLERLLRDRL